MESGVVRWGIIGCGDVTEVKSGPAFNKVSQSQLVAVMRRNAAKAEDYAQRHNVPKWYSDADKLINDPEVNAVYIATPPSSHLKYTLACMEAGKPVYVEKPMALNYEEARAMVEASRAKNVKLVVAHYRREQPQFRKVKELIDSGIIGDIRLVNLNYYHPPLKREELAVEKNAWRVDPAISGGGLFHDIAPHPIDLALYFFGPVERANGVATNQGGLYEADDIVSGSMVHALGPVFNGIWCFNVSQDMATDSFEIIGSKGKIHFGVFRGNTVTVSIHHKKETYSFDKLRHVQEPMIEATVRYFLGKGPNPCTGEEGAESMRMIDAFVAR